MIVAAMLLAQAAPDLSAEATRVVDEQSCRNRGTEIVVCGRKERNEKYRMPDRNGPFNPDGDMESVMRERSRWMEGANSGIQSCSAVGPGGWTGCLVKQWEEQRQQTQWGKNRPKGY